jgi:hypothetical protein
MRTDNDYNHTVTSGWSASSDSVNIIQTPSQGFFWSEPWSTWECIEEPRRYAQPALLLWPLALLARLWKWLLIMARPT